ncbi:MAG TPA: hypothetical protein VKB08_08650, partial [Bradyrhizobium sp.]|nr:hypothetical protein [Bradyrhizobium sp.]
MAVLSPPFLLSWLRRRLCVAGLLIVVMIPIAGGLVSSGPAFAQSDFITFPTRPAPKSGPGLMGAPPPSGNAQMLVQATEINYDYANNRVSAVGNVQIYYNGS